MAETILTSLGDLRRFSHGLDSMTPFMIYEGSVSGKEQLPRTTGDVHFDPQLFIVLSGGTDFFLDDISFKGRKGDIFLSSFWEPHAFRRNTKNLHFLAITFSMFSLGTMTPFADFDWHLFIRQDAKARKITFEKKIKEEILLLAKKISQLEKTHPAGFRSMQWFFIHEIMFYINTKYISCHDHLSAGDLIRIFPALELIRHDPGHEIPLNKAAAECSMSRSTFCQQFKETMKESFSRFAMRKRIGYSCMLLRLNKWSIKEISDQCGFKNITHFYHVFKKFRNCTPLEFLDEIRDSEKN